MRWISNVRLAGPPRGGYGDGDGAAPRWRLAIDDDQRISQLQPIAAGTAAAGEDWQGDWLSLAGVDLQINGGLGLAFPELGEAQLPQLEALRELLWRDGVEAICPTLVTCGVGALRQSLQLLATARQQRRAGHCQLLGAHLEGPFLAPARRGAHPLAHICAPSLAALAERIAGFRGGPTADIALVTLAPELEGAAELIAALKRHAIAVSLGHSDANESQAQAAFAAGVTMLTHSFNAMGGLGHRAPGPIAAALLRGQVALGLIADGVHVAPSMALLLMRLAPEQLVLVSDALAPYGLGEGRHRWDERLLIVADGSCRLEDGTLAGVTLPLLEGVRRLASWGAPPEQAIAAATLHPRRVLGERRPMQQQLLGRPLVECLRWSGRGAELSWRRPSDSLGSPGHPG